MSTPKHNLPRILVNYGNGSEVLDLMMRADLEAAPAEFAWWSKSDLATERIRERLPKAAFLESQTRHLAALVPPFPLRKHFPEKCSTTKIQGAVQSFPAEWIAYTLRWDAARASQQGHALDEIHNLMAALHLSEAVRILALTQPDLLLLRGGNTATDAALAIVAMKHDIPVLYTERGAFPESLFLADTLTGPEMMREEVASDADAANDENHVVDQSELRLESDASIAQYLGHDRSAWMQPPREAEDSLRQRWEIPADHRIIFYAAQRPADANMLLNSPHFSSNGDFVRYVLRAINGMKKVALVVKPHPKESPASDREIHEALQAAKRDGIRVACDRDVNIKDAIKLSSVVVSINSTTGAEALLHGVPVVVGGEAYYSHRGYTFDVQSSTDPAEIERLRTFLQQPEYSRAQQEGFYAFICRLNARHQFFMQPIEGQNSPNDYVRIVAQTAAKGREKSLANGCTPRLPCDLICHADALSQQFSELRGVKVTPPAPTNNQLVRLSKRLSTKLSKLSKRG